MIFDAVALIVLSGMMLVPIINIVVGLIVGAWLAGPAGVPVGLALAVLISVIQKWLGDRLGWFEPKTTILEEVRPHVAPQVIRPRHASLSAPVHFTQPVPPLPPMIASAARSASETEAHSLLN